MASAETSSLAGVLERYEKPLIRYAHGFTQDIEEARDVVQDVFLKYTQHMITIPPERTAAWLFTVCKNRALDFQRKNVRLVRLEPECIEERAAPDAEPSRALEARETAAALRSWIELLPTRQREAITLKFVSGLDYREISEVMGTSVGNVGYLIHHGVQALREHWHAFDRDPAQISHPKAAALMN